MRAVHKLCHPLKGEGRSTKRWHYSINLFSTMCDKRKGAVNNLKKWVMSFMDISIVSQFFISSNQPRHTQIFPQEQHNSWVNIHKKLNFLYSLQCSSYSLISHRQRWLRWNDTPPSAALPHNSCEYALIEIKWAKETAHTFIKYSFALSGFWWKFKIYLVLSMAFSTI